MVPIKWASIDLEGLVLAKTYQFWFVASVALALDCINDRPYGRLKNFRDVTPA